MCYFERIGLVWCRQRELCLISALYYRIGGKPVRAGKLIECLRYKDTRFIWITGNSADQLRLKLMDQSQEILLGHAIIASRDYGYHGYRDIARPISNKFWYLTETCLQRLHSLHSLSQYMYVAVSLDWPLNEDKTYTVGPVFMCYM